VKKKKIPVSAKKETLAVQTIVTLLTELSWLVQCKEKISDQHILFKRDNK